MPRDAAREYSLLARVLRDPGQLSALSPADFSHVIDLARDARLLGWLLARADDHAAPKAPPAWLLDKLTSARRWSGEYERALRWEIDRLSRAFLDTNIPWVLLKGAAYLAAALPPGRGRRVADIDVLVRHADLNEVEQLLKTHGWEMKTIDSYDERYYREWMHEIPPMVHKERRSVVDVHHAILPRTSRLQPSSVRLIDRAVVAEQGTYVLCPSHMVLHAAAHMFHDGEIAGGLRDLVDLDQLLRSFQADPAFWHDLLEEAQALELTRPLYYALRYTNRWLATPIPPDVTNKLQRWGPDGSTRRLMDGLVERAIPVDARRGARVAAFALYVRSHWLRMPPVALVRHLARKSFGASRLKRVP